MGRTLKRVPLDFDWPQGEIWEGYLNPIRSTECTTCHGSGYSPQACYLNDKWYSFDRSDYVWCDETHTRRWNRAAWCNNLDAKDVQALIDADRLWDFTRVPITEEQRQIVAKKIEEGGNSWLPFSNGYVPTPEEVNEWNRQGLGHDSLNAHIVIEAKLKRRGQPLTCDICNGEGCIWESPEQKGAYDAWEPVEPPTGEGYQLWETTSEGSPDSPVFATLDALCEWCAEHATTFASYAATAEEWKRMLDGGMVHHQAGNMIFL